LKLKCGEPLSNAGAFNVHVRRYSEVYDNARITHSLVDNMVGEMAGGGAARATPERRRTWVHLWDLFGPPGARQALRTSPYAKQ
jgi:hypothetical protein